MFVLTARGLPLSLQTFFQDHTFENIDPETDAFTVIERTLAKGDRQELAWLFRQYPREQIVEVVSHAGWWRLPRPRFYFWVNVLDVTEYRRSDYQPLWQH